MFIKLIFGMTFVYLKNIYSNQLNYVFELLSHVKGKSFTTSYL